MDLQSIIRSILLEARQVATPVQKAWDQVNKEMGMTGPVNETGGMNLVTQGVEPETPIKGIIDYVMKNFIYNSYSKRALPASPYWQITDADKIEDPQQRRQALLDSSLGLMMGLTGPTSGKGTNLVTQGERAAKSLPNNEGEFFANVINKLTGETTQHGPYQSNRVAADAMSKIPLADNEIGMMQSQGKKALDILLERKAQLQKGGFSTANVERAIEQEMQVGKQLPKELEGLAGAEGSKTLYRGSPSAYDPLKVDEYGVSLTTSPTNARAWTSGEKGGLVQEFQLDKNAKILAVKDIPKNILNKINDETEYIDLVNYAKRKGYDGIDMRDFGEDEIRVINPKVIKNLTQDFYNQAKGGKK